MSGKKYNEDKETTKAMRIIADHVKASVFIIAEGIAPSNKEQGYILRRLIRRAVRYGMKLGLRDFVPEIAKPVFEIYEDYEMLGKKKKNILEILNEEESKFNRTLSEGMRFFSKIIQNKKEISGKDSFFLYQSCGFPIEMIMELAEEKGIKVNKKDFESELKKHQELSRTAAQGKFKSGLADSSEATTKLHTASHLLLSALRIILKDNSIIQKGSNITPERLRLDFSFPRALTDEEIKKIENLVNSEIKKCQDVIREEMSPREAKRKGFGGIFDKKYGEKVSVYTIGNFFKGNLRRPSCKKHKRYRAFQNY